MKPFFFSGLGSVLSVICLCASAAGPDEGFPQGTSEDCTSAWVPVFAGTDGVDDWVEAMVVFDDGSGPALYAGGRFTTAGGNSANNIARWDGESWSSLGSGMNGTVHALAVFDDGSGPALYAGGEFDSAGGVNASYVARWNGTSWSSVGLGMDDWVRVLKVFDAGLGAGPSLYAGGRFEFAGLVGADRIARWDGNAWSALGEGVYFDPLPEVFSMKGFNDGSGMALYVGGRFGRAGDDVTVNGVARWNGSQWSALQNGTSGTGYGLESFDDGSGLALYVVGNFSLVNEVMSVGIGRWHNGTWGPYYGTQLNSVVYVGRAYDDNSGNGPGLYIGGNFSIAGGVPGTSRIARLDQEGWHALGSGMDDMVLSLAEFDDGLGDGPALYVGGRFSQAGGQPANHIAKWACRSNALFHDRFEPPPPPTK